MRFWIARGIPVNSWIPLPFAMHLASKGAFTVYMLPDDMSLLPRELVPVGVRTCGATFLRSMPVQCGIPLPVNRALVNFTLHRSLLERQSLKARGKKKKKACVRESCLVFSARSGPVRRPLVIHASGGPASILPVRGLTNPGLMPWCALRVLRRLFG